MYFCLTGPTPFKAAAKKSNPKKSILAQFGKLSACTATH